MCVCVCFLLVWNSQPSPLPSRLDITWLFSLHITQDHWNHYYFKIHLSWVFKHLLSYECCDKTSYDATNIYFMYIFFPSPNISNIHLYYIPSVRFYWIVFTGFYRIKKKEDICQYHKYGYYSIFVWFTART